MKKGTGLNLANGIFSIVAIIVLVQIYQYLTDIESCPCFKSSQHKGYRVNLEYMKFYQVLEIMTLLIFLASSYMLRNKRLMKGGSKSGMNIISILSMLLLLYIFGYMSYNVFAFYMSIKDSCKCADKWQKYFIYIQGLSSSVSTLQLLLGFLFAVIIILTSIKI